MSNDNQVIAMHWLHIRGRRDAKDELAIAAFSGERFNFSAAAVFTVKRGYSSKKADLMGLTPDEVWDVDLFDDKTVRKQWASIQRYKSKAERQLRQVSHRNSQMRKNVDEGTELITPMLIVVMYMSVYLVYRSRIISDNSSNK